MPKGSRRRTERRFAPASVLECFAATEEDVVLVNTSDEKIGAEGRAVVDRVPFTVRYRPVKARPRGDGLRPSSRRPAWYLDRAVDAYRRLDRAMPAGLVAGADR